MRPPIIHLPNRCIVHRMWYVHHRQRWEKDEHHMARWSMEAMTAGAHGLEDDDDRAVVYAGVEEEVRNQWAQGHRRAGSAPHWRRGQRHGGVPRDCCRRMCTGSVLDEDDDRI